MEKQIQNLGIVKIDNLHMISDVMVTNSYEKQPELRSTTHRITIQDIEEDNKKFMMIKSTPDSNKFLFYEYAIKCEYEIEKARLKDLGVKIDSPEEYRKFFAEQIENEPKFEIRNNYSLFNILLYNKQYELKLIRSDIDFNGKIKFESSNIFLS